MKLSHRLVQNPLKNKSFSFAIKIVQLSHKLAKRNNEFVLSKQILRSGTSIGAMIHEAEFGRSKIDFANKLCIALKEANETEYWLRLLKEVNYLEEDQFLDLQSHCKELIAMLVSSVKSSSN